MSSWTVILFFTSSNPTTNAGTNLLTNILINKFNLECNYHMVTNGYIIYIFSSYKTKLIELVKPYFIEQFYYKLDIEKK